LEPGAQWNMLSLALQGGSPIPTVGYNITDDERGNHAIVILLLIAQSSQKALGDARWIAKMLSVSSRDLTFRFPFCTCDVNPRNSFVEVYIRQILPQIESRYQPYRRVQLLSDIPVA
jgi:hypothetical protein